MNKRSPSKSPQKQKSFSSKKSPSSRPKSSRDSERDSRSARDARRPERDSRPARDVRSVRRPERSRDSERDSRSARDWRNREEGMFVWGKHAVSAFLTQHQEENREVSSTCVLHLLVDKTNSIPHALNPIHDQANALGVKVVSHVPPELSEWPLGQQNEVNHQRVCLSVPEYPVQDMSVAMDAIRESQENDSHGCVGLVLDQVHDPRNFGAILRSAAFFGFKFVIFGKDRQAEVSSLVLKSSAGGAFFVPLIPVVNINRALAELKEGGAWIVGAAVNERAVSLKKLPKDRSWVVVLGNEGKGLRVEVEKNCDFVAKIEGGQKTIDSLNVSVAAGIFAHELSLS